MDLGMIGLGRMGANMTERLVKGGHRVVGFDPQAEARARVEDKGAESAGSLDMLVASLKRPRTLWMMLPAGGITDATVTALLPLLAAGDVLVDGGNSNYTDTLRRSNSATDKKIGYVDCGTSGGVWGLAEGYSMMVGGDEAVVGRLQPIFETLAPGRPGGLRPLRQNDSQRHRIRTDAGVCRRLFHSAAQARVRLRPARNRRDLALR